MAEEKIEGISAEEAAGTEGAPAEETPQHLVKKVKRRPVRNNAPKIIGDYWTTNRQYYRENKERAEKELPKGKWLTTEKIYLAIIIICLILILIKYKYTGTIFYKFWE